VGLPAEQAELEPLGLVHRRFADLEAGAVVGSKLQLVGCPSVLVLGEKAFKVEPVRRCTFPFLRSAAVVLDSAKKSDDATKLELLLVVESLACPQDWHVLMISFGSDVTTCAASIHAFCEAVIGARVPEP
jgi:hypothetical protein